MDGEMVKRVNNKIGKMDRRLRQADFNFNTFSTLQETVTACWIRETWLGYSTISSCSSQNKVYIFLSNLTFIKIIASTFFF